MTWMSAINWELISWKSLRWERTWVPVKVRECLSTVKVICLENNANIAWRGKEEVEILKVLMLLHKAAIGPHPAHCLKFRESSSKWKRWKEELLPWPGEYAACPATGKVKVEKWCSCCTWGREINMQWWPTVIYDERDLWHKNEWVQTVHIGWKLEDFK